MAKSKFQQENDQILEYSLNNFILNKFREPVDEQTEEWYIELNITATCNQECNYCYLVKYGDKLYPKELRKQSLILNNIKIFLQYLYEKGINPRRYDFFSGEIWGTKFGDLVFDIFLDFIENKKITPKLIIIPANCSFTYDEKLIKKIDYYCKRFDELGTRLVFSCSMDGLLVESDSRPFKNKNNNYKKDQQENYDKLFKWCRKHDFGFHPMVSASNVDKWIENYNWWAKMFDKYQFNLHSHIMTLEVRNDDWTDDKIEYYLKFLNHIIDYDFEHFYHKDRSGFVNDITYNKSYNGSQSGYTPYKINQWAIQEDLACTIKKSIVVRMGDLSIGPCHRTCYPEFIYGKYDIEDNKIIGVTANNIQLLNRVYFLNSYASMKCDSCPIAKYCMKGCLGAQYEANNEILYPCSTVCNFFKAKYIFLYTKFRNTFISDYAKTENEVTDRVISNFEKQVEYLKEDTSLWNKWSTISQSIATKIIY